MQLQIYARPYETILNNQIEHLTILIPLIILYAGLLFYSGKLPDNGFAGLVTAVVFILFAVAIILILYVFYEQFRLMYFQHTEKGVRSSISFLMYAEIGEQKIGGRAKSIGREAVWTVLYANGSLFVCSIRSYR